MNEIKIGVIGCGMISDFYFQAAKRFLSLKIVACADQNQQIAEKKAQLFGLKVLSIDELLADPEIKLVINLTPPQAHCAVDMKILQAGKHAYSEKPLGVDLTEAAQVLAFAAEHHLSVGCAPDTFLGGGLQTARKILDDNWIGKPIAGTAIVMGRGPEKWPHAPFFYDKGAGPMLDMGPYYITALVNLLGPVESVTAVTCKGALTRVGGPETIPHIYPINVDTHQTGILKFVNGTVVTMIASFEVYKHGHAPIEIYGDQGSLQVPDPNSFGGPVRVFRAGYDDWQDVPLTHGYATPSRSVGVADMLKAISDQRAARASSELAYHVLEVMLSFTESSKQGRPVMIQSRCQRPVPLPLGLNEGELD